MEKEKGHKKNKKEARTIFLCKQIPGAVGGVVAARRGHAPGEAGMAQMKGRQHMVRKTMRRSRGRSRAGGGGGVEAVRSGRVEVRGTGSSDNDLGDA